MNKLLLLLSICSTILFIACRKSSVKPKTDNNCQQGCYIITGRITDTPSNAGLKDVTMKLYIESSGYSLFGRSTTLLAQTTTAADGTFKFSVDTGKAKLSDHLIYETLAKTGYLHASFTDQSSLARLDKSWVDKPFPQKIAFFRNATLKVSVRFPQPVTGYHSADLMVMTGRLGNGYSFNVNQLYNQQLSYPVGGDVFTHISWNVYGPNYTSKSFKDSIIVPAGQERIYTINFP